MRRPGYGRPMTARLPLACLLLACLSLAGCGSGTLKRPPPSGPTETSVRPGPDGVQAVDMRVGDDYRFTPSIIDAHVGPIRITLHHVGQGAPHTLYGADVPGMRIGLIRPGETQSVQFTASRPGRFRFVCTIHEAQGQTGTLVVAPG
jgi:plastocyanin